MNFRVLIPALAVLLLAVGMNISTAATVELLQDSIILEQTSPDCKYPPCD